VIEKEIDGDAIAQPIKLPVVANGRIFPREDIDLYSFDAEAGKTVTAFVHAQSLNSPLVPKLDVLDTAGRVLTEAMTHPVAGADASVRFTAPAKGTYRVRVTDARSQGGPQYVYRLTLTTEPVPDHVFPLKAPADGLAEVIAPHAERRVGRDADLAGEVLRIVLRLLRLGQRQERAVEPDRLRRPDLLRCLDAWAEHLERAAPVQEQPADADVHDFAALAAGGEDVGRDRRVGAGVCDEQDDGDRCQEVCAHRGTLV